MGKFRIFIKNYQYFGLVRLAISLSLSILIIFMCFLFLKNSSNELFKINNKLRLIDSEIKIHKDFIKNFENNEKIISDIISNFNLVKDKYYPIDLIHNEDLADVMVDLFSKNLVDIYKIEFTQLDSNDCTKIIGSSNCKSYRIDFLFESFSESAIFTAIDKMSKFLPGVFVVKDLSLEVDGIFDNDEPLFYGNVSLEWIFMT